jgi:recombination protein RecT
MTKALTKPSKFSAVRDLILSQQNEIAAALPRTLTAERAMRASLTTFRKNPKLLNCTPQSLLGAIIQAAQLGFEINDALGHVYLIPFGKEVEIIIGYQGMIDLIRRAGNLASFHTAVVYEKEEYTYQLGANPVLKHVPKPPLEISERVAVYAVAHVKDGGTVCEWMWKDDVMKAKAMSKNTGKNSIWEKWPDEMWRKTVVRKIFKYLPKSVETQDAIITDGSVIPADGRLRDMKLLADTDMSDDEITNFDSDEASEKTQETTNALTEKLANAKNGTALTELQQKLEDDLRFLSNGNEKGYQAMVEEYASGKPISELTDSACRLVHNKIKDKLPKE